MSLRKTAVFAGILMALSATVGADELPYGFRGSVLGMGLDEFRKWQFPDPDPKEETMFEHRTVYGPAHIVCTGDAELHRKELKHSSNGALVSPDAQQAGLVQTCRFKRVETRYYAKQLLSRRLVNAIVNLAGVTAVDPTFEFATGTPGGSPKLFHIAMWMFPNDAYDAIVKAYVAKYGKPTKVEEHTVKTRAGAEFDNPVITWDNGISYIKIEKRDGHVDRMSIDYSYRPLEQMVEKAYEQLRAAGAAGKL